MKISRLGRRYGAPASRQTSPLDHAAPTNQPSTIPPADGQRTGLCQKRRDRVVANLAHVKQLQPVRRRTCESRRRTIGGHGSPDDGGRGATAFLSFSTSPAAPAIEWIDRPVPAANESCARSACPPGSAVPGLRRQIRLALAGEPFAECQLLQGFGVLEIVGTASFNRV
jgi:hypothetical protein